MLSSSPRQSTRLADKPRRTVLGVVNTAPRNLTPLPVKPGQTPEHSGETFAFPAFQLFSNSDVIPRFAAPPGHQQVPAQPDRTGGDLGGLLVGDVAEVYWSDGDGGWRLWPSTIVSTRGRLYAGARERGVLVRYSLKDGNGLPELDFIPATDVATAMIVSPRSSPAPASDTAGGDGRRRKARKQLGFKGRAGAGKVAGGSAATTCSCGRVFANGQALGGHRGKCKVPRERGGKGLNIAPQVKLYSNAGGRRIVFNSETGPRRVLIH